MLPIVGLITMLLCLAILQLRWSAKVSEAERSRLQQNLQQSTHGFQAAFAQDLLSICQTLQASQPRVPLVVTARLLDRYAVWHHTSGHAVLIDGLYLWQASNSADKPNAHGTLLQFNLQTGKLEPAAWPDALQE